MNFRNHIQIFRNSFVLGKSQQITWYNTVILVVKWRSEIYSYLSFIVPVELEVFFMGAVKQ